MHCLSVCLSQAVFSEKAASIDIQFGEKFEIVKVVA